jgi:hypothetical protein
VKSRRHLDRSIKRHVARSYPIAKSGIGSWRSERILSPKTPIRKIAKSRNDHSRPSHRTGGSRLSHRHIGIRGFKLSMKLDIATREIAIHEIPIRSQIIRPFARTRGEHRSARRHFGVRGFKLSKKFDIATREIAIREIPIRSQPSIFDRTRGGHQGHRHVSAFGVSR